MLFSAAPSHLVDSVSVLCVRDERFLLIERANAPYQHWLSFPGGKVEAGESGKDAAKREFLEETGLTATELKHLITLDFGHKDKGQQNYFLSVYHAVNSVGTVTAGDDALSFCWLSLAEMEKAKVIPSVLAVATTFCQNQNQSVIARQGI